MELLKDTSIRNKIGNIILLINISSIVWKSYYMHA